jgi:peroxiredoxin
MLLGAVITGCSGSTPSGSRSADTSGSASGSTIEFSLKDIQALDPSKAPAIRSSALKGRKHVVLFFMAAACSVSWRYDRRLNDLMNAYRTKDVEFLGVMSGGNDTPQGIRAFAKQRHYQLPILDDTRQMLAERLKVTVTPTFALIDKEGRLRYIGAFDDAPNEKRVKRKYLAEAVAAVLQGQDPPVAQTAPFG